MIGREGEGVEYPEKSSILRRTVVEVMFLSKKSTERFLVYLSDQPRTPKN